MSSHELAKILLEQPDYEMCTLRIDKKRHLDSISQLQIFEGTLRTDKRIAILTEGQKVNGNLYWLGDQPYVPKGHQLNGIRS